MAIGIGGTKKKNLFFEKDSEGDLKEKDDSDGDTQMDEFQTFCGLFHYYMFSFCLSFVIHVQHA